MEIKQKVINTMRALGLNQVVTANSGHTGIVLGGAPLMYAVFASANFVASDTQWANRDRIVLSAGHGSALLYSAMHLFGFLSMEDLQNFRCFGSKTPGHPEISTAGVDVSTGALGQGFANAVGLAMAEKMLQKYNKPKYKIYDHYTYAIVGDGDLMEGISYESASFASKNRLNKLIVLYDSNRISLDGETNITSVENARERFEACGWNVLEVKDGNNVDEILNCINDAKNSDKPNIIICHTILGFSSPFANTNKCHGNPFDIVSMNETIKNLGLKSEPFNVDKEVYEYCAELCASKLVKYNEWKKLRSRYAVKYPSLSRALYPDTKKAVSKLDGLKFKETVSTREASHYALQTVAGNLPALVGGSADLSKSTLAFIKNSDYFTENTPDGRNIAYGVREHAMGAISNGIALHGEFLPFASTFLVFSDYMKYSIRMASLMSLRELFIFTHDSIAVGEDGATHQPVEQIEALRLIPNLNVFRPCDATETIAGYKLALESNKPTVLVLSRQKLPLIKGSDKNLALLGGYVISQESNKKELHGIIIASGSEVELAIKAKEIMENDGLSIRVVSMPERELFFKQDKKYIEKVLPSKMKCRLVIEAGATAGWYRVVGDDGVVLGVDGFGASGKPTDIFNKFGLTLPNIVRTMDALIKKTKTIIDSII